MEGGTPNHRVRNYVFFSALLLSVLSLPVVSLIISPNSRNQSVGDIATIVLMSLFLILIYRGYIKFARSHQKKNEIASVNISGEETNKVGVVASARAAMITGALLFPVLSVSAIFASDSGETVTLLFVSFVITAIILPVISFIVGGLSLQLLRTNKTEAAKAVLVFYKYACALIAIYWILLIPWLWYSGYFQLAF